MSMMTTTVVPVSDEVWREARLQLAVAVDAKATADRLAKLQSATSQAAAAQNDAAARIAAVNRATDELTKSREQFEADCSERAASLTTRETMVTAREGRADKREQSMGDREAELVAREKQLASREQMLSDRLSGIAAIAGAA